MILLAWPFQGEEKAQLCVPFWRRVESARETALPFGALCPSSWFLVFFFLYYPLKKALPAELFWLSWEDVSEKTPTPLPVARSCSFATVRFSLQCETILSEP